jgi:membrane protease YdiL (CAAX protease family)
MLAVRAVGEGIFFQGFVTRTLLVENSNPAAGVFISAMLYGLYGVTYAALVDATAFHALFACFIYGFGGGFPFALMYWKVRSVPVLILVYFIVLMGSASGGVEYAMKYGAP